MLKDKLKLYWVVHVTKDIAIDGIIHLKADSVEYGESGQLCFMRHDDEGDILQDYPVACFASGKWTCFFAASCIDGDECCVEHWRKPCQPIT